MIVEIVKGCGDNKFNSQTSEMLVRDKWVAVY